MAAETLEENKIWDLGTDRGIKANAVNWREFVFASGDPLFDGIVPLLHTIDPDHGAMISARDELSMQSSLNSGCSVRWRSGIPAAG
jgi:hypothetical protein